MTASIPRKPHLDTLKAVACILVVLGHAITYFGDHVRELSVAWQAPGILIYAVHVPLFFTIAGYLCHRQPIGSYAKKKVFRVLIPFLTFTVLKLLYSCFFSSEFSHGEDLAKSLLSALLTGELYWFVYAILLMYAVAPLFWEKEDGATPALLWCEAAVMLLAAVLSCVFTLTGLQLPSILQIQNTVLNIIFFLAGMMIRQREEAFLRFVGKARPFLLPVCLFIAAGAVLIWLKTRVPLIWPVATPTAFALMFLLWSGVKALPGQPAFLAPVGRYSLQIMLFDSFFKVLLFGLWTRVFPTPAVMILVFTSVDVFLGWLSCRICEKIPGMRILVGL